ncbi:hypothetical protein HRbin30_01178 [bacterium HR30]|nr:hypothetical protein HRbin30_01178 [bacterium HR30]
MTKHRSRGSFLPPARTFVAVLVACVVRPFGQEAQANPRLQVGTIQGQLG